MDAASERSPILMERICTLYIHVNQSSISYYYVWFLFIYRQLDVIKLFGLKMIFIVLGLWYFLKNQFCDNLYWAWHKLIFCQHEMQNFVIGKVTEYYFCRKTSLTNFMTFYRRPWHLRHPVRFICSLALYKQFCLIYNAYARDLWTIFILGASDISICRCNPSASLNYKIVCNLPNILSSKKKKLLPCCGRLMLYD